MIAKYIFFEIKSLVKFGVASKWQKKKKFSDKNWPFQEYILEGMEIGEIAMQSASLK